MPKRKLTANPESRLDRVSRDLNRTFLHGSRVKCNDGIIRPSHIATGQQIRADVPANNNMVFQFAAGESSRPVVVPQADAKQSERVMRAALQKPEKYFKLNADNDIPTWIFHQREFSLPDKPGPEEILKLADGSTLLRLPATVLQEVERATEAPQISLWKYEGETQSGKELAPTWQPAILLRFQLNLNARAPAVTGDQTMTFEVQGVPQGDRYHLDKLLDSTPQPEIAAVRFFLEENEASAPETMNAWTLLRTNLTEEARAGRISFQAGPTAWPFVATNNEPEDSLRLLQMNSITNSGGYFITLPVGKPYKTLAVSILLKSGQSKDGLSLALPFAANAVIYPAAGPVPNVARFEGLQHVHVTPAAPPGFVSFGWKRQEPAEKNNDEERFGYGTISLVAYQATDAAGRPWETEDRCIAISPQRELPGDHVRSQTPPGKHPSDITSQPSSALRLLAPYQLNALARLRLRPAVAGDPALLYYRGTVRCYDQAGAESPYAPLADPTRRTITISPGFRDVYGNRFPMSSENITRSLFYTDAVLAPSEWPGVQFRIYPGTLAGRAILSLEAAYMPTQQDADRSLRYLRLTQLLQQLKGATLDVQANVIAAPLVSNPVPITAELIDWLQKEVLPLEANPPRAGQPRRLPPHTFPPFACDAAQIPKPQSFKPELQVRRTNSSLLPQANDLPGDPDLRTAVLNDITAAASPIPLAKSASPRLVLKDSDDSKDEFKRVAQAFQEQLSGPLGLQIAFQRNQLNQHELWLIPNNMFPAAPSSAATSSAWSFATARPLGNTLLTQDLVVPDFTGQNSPIPSEGTWKGYPLRRQHFVEMDIDELGRSAFGLIERNVLTPEFMAVQKTVEEIRTALKAKDTIARLLANADPGKGPPPYLVPLFKDALPPLENNPINRTAADAFLKNLIAFYSVDTIIQLPLERPGDQSFAMFQGRLKSPFSVSGPAARSAEQQTLPAFSDVLLKGGEGKVTVLYNVPPGTYDPNTDEVPQVPNALGAITVHITHVQRPPEAGLPQTAAFNRGFWLELVTPVDLQWYGIGGRVPVAIRRFPAKPAIDSATVQPLVATTRIHANDTQVLIKWGWEINLEAEGLTTDRIHGRIRYNEPDSGPGIVTVAGDEEWKPTSVLHCLVVLKQLGDHWATIDSKDRLSIASALMASLAEFLANPQRALSLNFMQPLDMFDITFPFTMTTTSQVMGNIEPKLQPALVGKKTIRLTARADDNANKGFLIGTGASLPAGPVANFRPSLRLTRNEAIAARPLDSRLVYECATVESPREVWARNSWTPPLVDVITFVPEPKQTLLDALASFFKAFFNNAPLPAYAVEVGAALRFRREGLAIETPYSIIPMDQMPDTTERLASIVFMECKDLLKTPGGQPGNVIPPAETDEAALRIHIKVSQRLNADLVGRTLVEIGALEFPLQNSTLTKARRLRKGRKH